MKIGLVLAGGGAKGAYELGVWKALEKLNITRHISVFSGTSIGAFNSILFAMDDLEMAEKMWSEVTVDKLVPASKLDLLKRGLGLYVGGKNMQLAKKFLADNQVGAISNEGAIDVVERYLDFEKIINSNKICYATCAKMPNLTARYFRINDYDIETAKKIILASASLPLIYESTEVLGEKFIDGGVVDNIPIQPVYGENCDLIIVVALSRDVQIDRNIYPNAKLIIITPENLTENAITGTLSLDENLRKMRIIEGYNDTINRFEPIMELMEHILDKEKELAEERELIKEVDESNQGLFRMFKNFTLYKRKNNNDYTDDNNFGN